MTDPHPKDYSSKEEYLAAVRQGLDYGYCNPIKVKMADEDEQTAAERWDEWHDD